jgi:hypothetical protein
MEIFALIGGKLIGYNVSLQGVAEAGEIRRLPGTERRLDGI